MKPTPDDLEPGFTMEAILRLRGYPDEVIEQIAARKKARIAETDEE